MVREVRRDGSADYETAGPGSAYEPSVSETLDEAALDELERRAFTYFLHEVDARTGLVRDNTRRTAPASVAGSGFALACYAVAAERGYISRSEAADRVRTALRFLWEAPQGEEPDRTGCRGFFYHFLTLDTGRRIWDCELSTIDTTIALAGALTAGVYFDGDTPAERDVRSLADAIYRRVEWPWSTGGARTVSLGWHPKSGFSPYGWRGHAEALMLYILGPGSPTHPLPSDSYAAWTETYRWARIYGYEILHAGPLFIRHLSQCWIDFRGIQDEFMRVHRLDYFENSRRAAYVQQEYARRNPRRWAGYSATCWGVTASDGPGPATRVWAGKRRMFYGYHARGVPHGPDDGTLSPWAVVASLPFAPEIVLPSIAALDAMYPEVKHDYGYTGSFNPSFGSQMSTPTAESLVASGWRSPAHYAINQGPVVLMIENHRSGLLWRLMRQCPYVVAGLGRAGFRGGWLEGAGAPVSNSGSRQSESRPVRRSATSRSGAALVGRRKPQ